MLPSEGAAVVGQNTNGKVVAFEGTAKAPYSGCSRSPRSPMRMRKTGRGPR